MTDVMTPEVRSFLMSRIRGKNTKLEMVVRRLVWSMGLRYRLYRRDLPGCPDIVFSGRKKAIFIHGCFWHKHDECAGGRIPKSNRNFWMDKLKKNRLRDEVNQQRLRELGWDVLVIWECETKGKKAPEFLREKIRRFLGVE